MNKRICEKEKVDVFRAAAVQMSPVLFDRDATTEKVLQNIKKCGQEGAQLVVFPETIIPNYPYFAAVDPPLIIRENYERLFDQAVELPGPVTEAIGQAAAKAGAVVVIGVNERDGGSLYNTQAVFDADGTFLGKRRKIMPTFHERLIWGWGDGSGLVPFDTHVGRVGALICWEHYMPLARYALMAQGEEIHCSHFPGSLGGTQMAAQIDAAIRHHAMEAGAFVVNATGWLSEQQCLELAPKESMDAFLKGGHCTAIVSPSGMYLSGPLEEGEGLAIAEIDKSQITRTKYLLDSVGHYSRPDILRLWINQSSQSIMDILESESVQSADTNFSEQNHINKEVK